MKIDFHTHGKLAKKLPLSIAYLEVMLREAKAAGLDAICLTEHFNTIGFDQLYKHIATHYVKEGETYLFEGLRIFPGMEVDIAEGEHVLVLGAMEAILALNKDLGPYKAKANFVAFDDLAVRTQNLGLYMGLAHPYRLAKARASLSQAQLGKLAFIDLNGKDLATFGQTMEAKVYALGLRLGLPVVSGSDTHQPNQYACIYTEFEKDYDHFYDLLEAMGRGAYTLSIATNIVQKVDEASRLKAKMKALHLEGRDYVADYLGNLLV